MSPHPLRYAQRLDYSSVALTIIITAALQPTPHPSALADSFPSKDKPLGWMLLPTTIMRCYGSSPNHAPWHADEIGAGRAQHDRRGNIQGDGWRLRRSGHENFPCHGGQQVARATPNLKPVIFTSHTGSLLLSSLKKVTFPCSRPLFAKSSAGEQAPPALQIMFSFL